MSGHVQPTHHEGDALTDPNNEQLPLPERVSKLEQELPEVRRDANDALNMARVLDRDVSELQHKRGADLRILTALRETQIDHGTELRELRNEVNGEFKKVHTKLGTLGAGMEHITELLTTEMNRRE